MKPKNKIINLSFLIILICALTYGIVINPIKTKSVKVIVIDKFDKDHLKKYKSSITITGIETWMRIYSHGYGYTDIEVTTDTYMTSKVGDMISFQWDERKIASHFNLDEKTFFHRDPIAMTIILVFTWFFVIFGANIDYIFNLE